MTPWKDDFKTVPVPANRFLKVELHELELPTGNALRLALAHTPDYANVWPAKRPNGFYVSVQTKYAVEGGHSRVADFSNRRGPLHAAHGNCVRRPGTSPRSWLLSAAGVVCHSGPASRTFPRLDAEPMCPPCADIWNTGASVDESATELEPRWTRRIQGSCWVTIIALGGCVFSTMTGAGRRLR